MITIIAVISLRCNVINASWFIGRGHNEIAVICIFMKCLRTRHIEKKKCQRHQLMFIIIITSLRTNWIECKTNGEVAESIWTFMHTLIHNSAKRHIYKNELICIMLLLCKWNAIIMHNYITVYNRENAKPGNRQPTFQQSAI